MPELVFLLRLRRYIGCGSHETEEIRRTAAYVHLVHQYAHYVTQCLIGSQSLEELTSRDLAGGGL